MSAIKIFYVEDEIFLSKIIKESFNQAFGQIIGNKLRSSLSLLGITIGVVCIVGVQAMVDSLETNVRSSLQKLGDDVIYVMKFLINFNISLVWLIFKIPP